MMDSLIVIKREHRNLYRVVHLLDALVRGHARGEPLDLELMTQIFEYIETFVDRFHHPKEDRYLFARLRQRNPMAIAILDELEDEHRSLPNALARMRVTLDEVKAEQAGAEARLADQVATYLKVQTKHLQKEEGVVLPMAQNSLTEEDWAEIDAAFADNQDPLFGQEARKEARTLFHAVVNAAPAPYGLGH
ncbi:hemerythrin domain-containing protein [Roseospira visakhapatnamensis]|uniref:Hemerythrin-like domain-containing protein n=1 Tax=Roseospira visakhapatnamensis TaxID=390880 RepID=A0A7W6RD33_9PROT|nr:hemerythrin domain-containing protein [Roseospira visakhapatnamensis]MBB4266258.1 hemerythrin-like domain-containing protein [Roseospira visakhapatnamensis]